MTTQETRAELLQRQEEWKAGLLIRSLKDGAMDYENSVLCLKHTMEILEGMRMNDPAFNHFAAEANALQRLCSAHAILNKKNPDYKGSFTDHLNPVKVLWAYRNNEGEDVLEETVLYIPLMCFPLNVDFQLSVEANRRLIYENLKYENLTSLQVVRA